MGNSDELIKINIHRIKNIYSEELIIKQLIEFTKYRINILKDYTDLKFFIENYKNMNVAQLNWEKFCFLMNNVNRYPRNFKAYLLDFFKLIIRNGLYVGNYKEFLEKNLECIFKKDYRVANRVDNVFVKLNILSNYPINSNPQKLVRYEIREIRKNIRYKRIVTLNLTRVSDMNIEILLKFIEFYTNKCNGYSLHDTTRTFIFLFQDSLYSTKKFNDDSIEFSYDTFINQYRFFKKIENIEICNSEFYKLTIILRDFYLYLYLFNNNVKNDFIHNGIDRYYLEQINFYSYFNKGCKVIKYSYDDKPPKVDCFLIDCKYSREIQVNVKSENYNFVNLRKVKNKKIIHLLKEWIWYGNGDISDRARRVNVIAEALNLIDKIKKKNKINEGKYFDIHTLILFNHELNRVKESNNYNTIIKKLKVFFKYIKETYPEIIDSNFEFIFKSKKIKGTRLDKAITREDYQIIYSAALKLDDEIILKILIIFSNSSLRLGSIINLRADCIIEKYESGAGKIRTYTKTSNGEIEEMIVNNKVISCIEDVLKITNDMRQDNLDKEVCKYLFIKRKNRTGIGLYNQNFNRNFKKIILENKDKLSTDYTAYDLRHFYIDFVVTSGVKEGKSYSEISSITNNKPSTFLKFYVNKYNMETYVETMGRALLEDEDISGSIIENIEFKQIVEDNLGICKEKTECISLDYDTCLSCGCFCTSIEKIDEFERKIKELNDRIEFGIGDERENQLLLQLCMKYLIRLLEVKDECKLSDKTS